MSTRTDGFDLLHPAVQHHVVNSLGWRSLRPLQSATIAPILAGDHVLAMAPTAGGKTEAAIFPVLSRMLTDDWRGLTVLYVCPLRALLNNLYERLTGYATLLGRTVGLWHGDVSAPQRRKLQAEPPDILLTTPESLEAMLVSTGVAHDRWFASLRVVVIDEAHAFASDDRGWHLLAVMAKLSRLAGRELQRIALSATIGNPDEVQTWLTTGCRRPSHVINPPAPNASPPGLVLDYVGSLANAALVISRLHRGAKRLVFVDSRARAEKLAAALRGHEVTTFVSHGSLGVDQRRQAEHAFAEARDCVIVATSTLELGIDVGDLDHVIQIDAPSTVTSLLQRLGRTGRRPGTARNMTVLATSDLGFTLSMAVLLRWSEGYVEPVVAPPLPLHLVGQQLLALALQEGQIGRHTWREWFGDPFVLGNDAASHADAIVAYLLEQDYLVDTGGEMLSVGPRAESKLGRRHFMELLAVFTAPPLFSVRHGRHEIGHVTTEVLTTRPPNGGPRVLLLAGRNWQIDEIDWRRRIVRVQPTNQRGAARWSGQGGLLGASVARAVRDVLVGAEPAGVQLSARATERLAVVRGEHPWACDGATAVVTAATGATTWWSFAGSRANLWLASAMPDLRRGESSIDGLIINVDPGTSASAVSEAIKAIDWHSLDLAAWISSDAIEGLKFAELLPPALARQLVMIRLRDDVAAKIAASEPVGSASLD